MAQCFDFMAVPLLGFETDPVPGKDEKQALEYALQLGYRYLSSNGLPENETVIGEALQGWFEQGRIKREDVFVSTKYFFLGSKPEDVDLRIKQSLSNLRLDYVDLYLLEISKFSVDSKSKENVSEEEDSIKFWEKMETTITSGKAKHIGVSNVTVDCINKIMQTFSMKPSCVQLDIQMDLQQCETVDFCRRNGISVIARIALENRYADLIVNAIIKKIGRKHEKTVAQILLRYLMQNRFSVVPKQVKKSRLKEYVDVHNFSLDGSDMQQLDALNIESCCRVYDCAALKRSENTSDLQMNV